VCGSWAGGALSFGDLQKLAGQYDSRSGGAGAGLLQKMGLDEDVDVAKLMEEMFQVGLLVESCTKCLWFCRQKLCISNSGF
jgi:hypothetical protein